MDYVQGGANENGDKEIWPMILEKAYAKLYGSYNNIVGGFVDEAIVDMTNGAPIKFDLKSADCK